MSRPRRNAPRGPSPLLVLGVVVLVAALSVAGWGIWQYWGSTLGTQAAAADRVAQVRAGWAAQDAPEPLVAAPEPGTAYWIMSIPALGDEWQWPVAAGLDAETLAETVGWYQQTAQPGQVGNFAVAGQCLTGAQPFRDLTSLAVGDAIVVETATDVHTYELISAASDLTVAADDGWVLDPVPGESETEPTLALITLTTCEDLYPTPDRSVAFGVLTSTEPA